MSELDAKVNRLPDPDLGYRALIDAHRGLTDDESASLNARLVLILASHIGDLGVLDGALRLARRSLRPTPETDGSPGVASREGEPASTR